MSFGRGTKPWWMPDLAAQVLPCREDDISSLERTHPRRTLNSGSAASRTSRGRIARSVSTMLDTAGAAEALNSIAIEEHTLDGIESEFRERVGAPDNPVAQAVVWMLGYQLVAVSEQSARARRGPFVPALVLPDRVFPPYLEDLGSRDDIRSVWRDLASLVALPAIKARLHDLLWVTERGPNRHRHAKSAIKNYLTVATPSPGADLSVEQRLESVDALLRALELSRLVGARKLVERVCARAVEFLASELEDEDARSRPGIWMRLLDLLISLGAEACPPHIGEYLVRAHELATSPDIRLSLFQMEERLARGRPAEIDRIQQAEAEMFISHAQHENGLSRVHWLTQALEIARGRRWGARTEARIRRELQQIDPDSYNWQEIKSDIRIPAETAESFVESIASGDRVETALARFAFVGGSPVGNRQESERVVDEHARKFVFLNLTNRSAFDEYGHPIRHAETDESKRELDILAHAARGIQWDALFRGLALNRIGERYAPDRATLTNFFLTELIDREQADAFARAFEHYWAERPDEAILVAIPRIEAVFRKLLEAKGGVIYDPPRGDLPGGVKGLGAVLRDLAGLAVAQMTDWWRFYRIALTEATPGLNLRNRYAHGLAATATKEDAAVVLRICVLLRFFGREGAAARNLRDARHAAVLAAPRATRKGSAARRYSTRKPGVSPVAALPVVGRFGLPDSQHPHPRVEQPLLSLGKPVDPPRTPAAGYRH